MGIKYNVFLVNGINLKNINVNKNIIKVLYSNILRSVIISNLLWNIVLGY